MTIGVAYFPTAITRISESEVAVAGRLEAGPSIIEKWTLGRPVYGETLVAGQYRRCLQVAPVLEQRVVLLRAEVGLDGVQGMTWMPGAFEPSLLVHFHDSKDLYRMRLRDGELVRVASPGSHRGVPEIPGLGAPFSHYAVRHHVERGYVYSFNMPGCTGTLERPWLVLADEDRDGVLDRERPMDDEVWEEWGFGSPQLWIDEVWSH